MFDFDDRQAMLEEIGVVAEIVATGQTFFVKPPRYSGQQLAFASSGDIESINPVSMADETDVVNLQIISGNSGTVIKISNRQYRVLSIEDASSGFSVLELGTP